LRRADFVPAKSLVVTADCTGTLDVETAVVTKPECDTSEANVLAQSFDLTSLQGTGLGVYFNRADGDRLMDWARLFSQKIPAGEAGPGIESGSAEFVPAAGGAASYWKGEWKGEVGGIAGLPPPDADSGTYGPSREFVVRSGPDGFVLAPMNLMPLDGKTAPLMLSGSAGRQGYTLNLAGTATEEQVKALMGLLPPVGEGVEKLMAEMFVEEGKPAKVDVSCSRAWGGMESCLVNGVVEVKRGRR